MPLAGIVDRAVGAEPDVVHGSGGDLAAYMPMKVRAVACARDHTQTLEEMQLRGGEETLETVGCIRWPVPLAGGLVRRQVHRDGFGGGRASSSGRSSRATSSASMWSTQPISVPRATAITVFALRRCLTLSRCGRPVPHHVLDPIAVTCDESVSRASASGLSSSTNATMWSTPLRRLRSTHLANRSGVSFTVLTATITASVQGRVTAPPLPEPVSTKLDRNWPLEGQAYQRIDAWCRVCSR